MEIKHQPQEEIEKENDEYYKLALAKVAKLNDFLNNNWTHWETTKMPAVISYNDTFENTGIRAIKAEFFIYANIKKVYEKVSDPKSFVEKLDTVTKLRDISDNLSLMYQRFKGFLVISPRDFLQVKFTEFNGDNATVLAFSVTNKNYPDCEKVTRAHQYYSGAYLHKVAENITFVTLFNNPDIVLTAFIAQKGLKVGCLEQIEKLKKICEAE